MGSKEVFWVTGREHTAFLGGDGNVPLLGKWVFLQLYPKLKNQSKALTGLSTCQTAVLFYLAYFKYTGLAKSHPIICQPWIIISSNWLNWGARCKENDPHWALGFICVNWLTGQMGLISGSHFFIPSQWNWLDSQQQSYGSFSFVPEGSHLLPFAIFKVFIAVYHTGTG